MRPFPSTNPAAPRLAASVLAALLGITLVPVAALAAADTQGFIYGKVKARSGTVYEGRLRWNEDEEAFWGDLMNGSKEERPYLDEMPRRDRRERGDEIRIFGIRISGRNWGDGGRVFVARFGDIKSIELTGGDAAMVTMKSGERYELDGGSNDLGAQITVWDAELGKVDLDWRKIESIELMPAPAGLEVDVFRLHGKMKTDVGDFEGFIQWDQEECLSTDKLDGESEDGDVSIEMGQIRTIERRSRRSSRVVLKSGREMVLDGTNDVNDENRGIYVEDPRYGRVLVNWDAFERLDFSDPGSSGPAYTDFATPKPLRGTVTDRDGKTYKGRIVYDIDEAETWEMLNGEWRDVEYVIPFSLIRAIVPSSSDSSKVYLRGGEELTLEDQVDVGEGNDGILIFTDGERDPAYVEWEDVDRIDFE